MTTDDFDEALELVVARTGVERYRHLCSDANTLPSPNSPADWRAWVLREAARPAGEAPPAPAAYDASWLPGPCGGCP